jgi:hypothetical protein
MGNASVHEYGFNISNPEDPLTVTDGVDPGNMALGSYVYAVTYVSAFGETAISPLSVVTATTTGSMLLSNIPLGNEHTLSRNIYRSYIGTTDPLYFLANVNTDTYTDTSNDIDLGTQSPATNTASSRTIIYGNNYLAKSPLYTTKSINADGTTYTDATLIDSDKQITFVNNVSGLNGVRLPNVDNDPTMVGKKFTVSNQDPVNSLNVYSNYSIGDNIQNVAFPNGYILGPLSNKDFLVITTYLYQPF